MQFCVECGTENRISHRYCVKCKTLLVLTVFEKTPMRRRTKLTIALGSALSLVGLAILVTPKPVSVAIAIEVTSPNGGIFAGDCELSSAALKAGADSIELLEFGKKPGEGTIFPVIYSDRDGQCLASSTLNIYPNATYEIYLAGQTAGQLTPAESETGRVSKSVSLTVLHNVKGSIVLSDFYSGCRDTNKGPDCVIPANTVVQAQLVKNICYGKNSFSDFVQGGPEVRFKGIGTKKTTSVKSEKGLPAIEDFASSKVTCTFNFKLPPLAHDEQGYEVSVGKHSAGVVSIKKLESSSWTYEFEFKN